MSLSLLLSLLLVAGCSAMPNGPPSSACFTMQPSHTRPGDNTPILSQNTASPVRLIAGASQYEAGDEINVALQVEDITSFRGFMIQARPADNDFGDPVGTFSVAEGDLKSQTMECANPNDTVSHKNPSDVALVQAVWHAPTTNLVSVKFYYTVVQDLETFWGMQGADHDDGEITAMTAGSTDPTAEPPGDGKPSFALIKAHGSIMTVAWGVVAPIGIILALFYKVVWPNGEWFYAHIAVMVTTLLLTLVGIVLIVVHAGGKWLSTTPINLPHQTLGLIVTVAVGVNPFLAIIRCSPDSDWRWIYNWAHGSIGMILGLLLAHTTMLLGLNVFREIAADPEFVHLAIYLLSSITGLVLMIIALYNIYNITFHKSNLGVEKLSPVSHSTPNVHPYGNGDYDDDNDEGGLEPTRDYPLRAGVGLVIIAVLAILAIVTIAFIALA